MILKDRYNIPQSTWANMVRDGVITSKVDRADDIISCYQKKRTAGIAHTESVEATADEMRCTPQWVYEQIRTWKAKI